MGEKEFINRVAELGIHLDEYQLRQLNNYYKILIEANKKINLTRIVEKEEVYLKHFYDSLTIQKIFDLTEATTLCDIGSGAGFPGIVLKICFPHLKVILIDSLNKRISFLQTVINKLELNNIEAIHIRAEELAKQNKSFDVVTARAVASLPKLLPLGMNLVNKNGCFIAMKANVENELLESQPLIEKNNWIQTKICNFDLPNCKGKRTLLEFKHKTNKNF